MYQHYGDLNFWGDGPFPLQKGCPLFRMSFIRGSTVQVTSYSASALANVVIRLSQDLTNHKCLYLTRQISALIGCMFLKPYLIYLNNHNIDHVQLLTPLNLATLGTCQCVLIIEQQPPTRKYTIEHFEVAQMQGWPHFQGFRDQRALHEFWPQNSGKFLKMLGLCWSLIT